MEPDVILVQIDIQILASDAGATGFKNKQVTVTVTVNRNNRNRYQA
jgi:hypothetical protein